MRLTEKKDSGSWCLRDVPWSELKPGAVLTEKTWKKIYGALWKLKDYEDAGKSPDEIKSLDDDMQVTAKGMLKKVAELSAEIDRTKTEEFWIPIVERKPDPCKWVCVSIKIHSWIDDADDKNIHDDGSMIHPEFDIVTLARHEECGRWKCIDPDDPGVELITVEDKKASEDSGYPVMEVVAWMPFPEAYREEKNE